MALDDTIGMLERAPIIRLFDRDALRLLAFSAELRRLRTGETLFTRGDRSDGGYVVLSGRVALTAAGADAPTVARPGDLVGRLALFVRTDRPATAVAIEPCEVLRVSPSLMRRVLAEFPATANAMHDAIASDLDELTSDLDRVRRMLAPDTGA